MNKLTKLYKQKCINEFRKLGFKSYRNNFYRVVNDVFQSFGLHNSVSGNSCTVEFGVFPLCCGSIITKNHTGANHLKVFENNYSWFKYDKNSIESIEQTVNSIIEYINKYLIPYFEKCNNSRNAYFEICNFQKKHQEGILMFDCVLFYCALKSGMNDLAIQHLKAQKAHTIKAYNRNIECFEMSVEYEEMIESEIHNIENRIEIIERLDFEGIEKIISENEALALKNLR